MIYIGVIVFQFFSNTLNEASQLIQGNINLVKKTIFPLEALPLINLLIMLFDLLIGFILLGIFYWFYFPDKNALAFYVPLLIFPLMLFTCACSFIIASLSVYIPDTQKLIGFILTSLMFLSGVFFPLSFVPAKFQLIVSINPIAFTIDAVRKVLIYNQMFDSAIFSFHLIVSCFLAVCLFLIFFKN